MSSRPARDERMLTTRSDRPLVIGRLTADSLPEVLEIERASYRAPWSVSMFTLELAKPQAISLGAWISGHLGGYAVAAPYDGVWHLLNLAVAPARRRDGVGWALLGELVRRLEEAAILTSGQVRMTLEVRRSNVGAQELYRRAGFLEAGVRPRYYGDNGEDALILWRTPATLRGRLDDVPGAGATR